MLSDESKKNLLGKKAMESKFEKFIMRILMIVTISLPMEPRVI